MTDIDAMATRFAELYMAKLEERGQCIVAKADIERLEAEAQALREERKNLIDAGLERDELRARVVVVPDRIDADAQKEDWYTEGWNDCLDELARLNGKAVSEGLLRRVITPALTSSDAQDRIDAQETLRDLLGEGKEHE